MRRYMLAGPPLASTLAAGLVLIAASLSGQSKAGPFRAVCTPPAMKTPGSTVCLDCTFGSMTEQCFPGMPPGYAYGGCVAGGSTLCQDSVLQGCGTVTYDCATPPRPLSPQPNPTPCSPNSIIPICN